MTKCEICGKSFKNFGSKFGHKKKFHPEAFNPNPDPPNPEKQPDQGNAEEENKEIDPNTPVTYGVLQRMLKGLDESVAEKMGARVDEAVNKAVGNLNKRMAAMEEEVFSQKQNPSPNPGHGQGNPKPENPSPENPPEEDAPGWVKHAHALMGQINQTIRTMSEAKKATGGGQSDPMNTIEQLTGFYSGIAESVYKLESTMLDTMEKRAALAGPRYIAWRPTSSTKRKSRSLTEAEMGQLIEDRAEDRAREIIEERGRHLGQSPKHLRSEE